MSVCGENSLWRRFPSKTFRYCDRGGCSTGTWSASAERDVVNPLRFAFGACRGSSPLPRTRFGPDGRLGSSIASMTATRPKPDELEVSLFGPGRGECVLVHLGFGDWMIVDSCRDQRSKRQPALEYLRSLHCDLTTDVRLVVTSHWHDDHVSGMSEVVKECVSADVWTTAAMTSNELLLATSTLGPSDLTEHNPFREYFDTVEALSVRSEGLDGAPIIKLASASKMLFRRSSAGVPATVEALSPSEGSVHDALAAIAATLPAADPQFSVHEPRPNSAAIVLRVEVAGAAALLGADLQQVAAADRGWKAVVNLARDRTPRSSIFKVPHHGSANGHNDEVWSLLLLEEPHAAVTPYRNSHLPQPTDLARLRSLTPNVHLSASEAVPAQRRGNRAVQASGQASSVRLTDVEGAAGQVRLRCSGANSGDVSVDVFGPARSLS
jgi:beta-lactamase superfamily II metal-dependent hydrolase